MTASDSYRIVLSKRVASDLESIFRHISKESPAHAPVSISKILDACGSLRLFPHHNVVEGQSPRSKHPVRSLPVGSYVVFFRVIESQRAVRVIHVRHGAGRRPKRF